MKKISDQELKDEALKYKTKSDFIKAAKSKYNVASSRGILKKFVPT